MKRLAAFVLSFILALSLVSPALAASDEAVHAANALYERGLFSGTGTDTNGNPIFDLDRTPTRHEAVTMLVRLLGKEKEARGKVWTTPFTDVADWARPFVGYAYANGLVNGTSATTFGGNETITASQYLTLVLRALLYESGTDFQWDRAWEFSDKIGLTNGQYGATTNFTRGDVAIISYNALSTDLKNSVIPLYATFPPGFFDADSTPSIPATPEPSVNDHSFLVATDFQGIRNQYPNAVATVGCAYEYTDLNGDNCVLTYVQYRIKNLYTVVTLHNLTQNKSIEDPANYYNNQASRAYGNSKTRYWNLRDEVLECQSKMLEDLVDILKTGNSTGSTIYVSPEILNQ